MRMPKSPPLRGSAAERATAPTSARDEHRKQTRFYQLRTNFVQVGRTRFGTISPGTGVDRVWAKLGQANLVLSLPPTWQISGKAGPTSIKSGLVLTKSGPTSTKHRPTRGGLWGISEGHLLSLPAAWLQPLCRFGGRPLVPSGVDLGSCWGGPGGPRLFGDPGGVKGSESRWLRWFSHSPPGQDKHDEFPRGSPIPLSGKADTTNVPERNRPVKGDGCLKHRSSDRGHASSRRKSAPWLRSVAAGYTTTIGRHLPCRITMLLRSASRRVCVTAMSPLLCLPSLMDDGNPSWTAA